jgi:two-component system, NtrC family, response regulator AtoC
MAFQILIIESDVSHAESLCAFFTSESFKVELATTGKQGFDKAKSHQPDCVILDSVLPDGDGISLVRQMNDKQLGIPCIMISGYGSVESAVKAMKLGVLDYLVKPLDYNALRQSVQKSISTCQQKVRRKSLELSRKHQYQFKNLIGNSPCFVRMVDQAQRISESPATTILLQGDSGTGKELFARAIHYNAKRLNRAFIEINCSAIPEGLLEAELFGHERGAFTGAVREKQGLFQLSDKGTLFLDEIGHMPISLQAKLVKAIEEKSFRRVGATRELHFESRIIAATNRNLKDAIRKGEFREDLYYRLQVIFLNLPSLLDRGPDDIELLAHHYVHYFSNEYDRAVKGFTPDALRMIREYSWPGNVRQLRNAIERAIILNWEEYIQPAHLQLENEMSEPVLNIDLDLIELPNDSLDIQKLEDHIIQKALKKHSGNQTRTAAYLRMSRDAFRYRWKRIQESGLGI